MFNKNPNRDKTNLGEILVRVAVIDREVCKPNKCQRECISFCPVNLTGGKAIEMDSSIKKPIIYEEVCIGCNICVRKCPFKAISIINLPEEFSRNVIHRYGVNGFKLHGILAPKRGQVLGLLGKNGTGKTTLLRILSGELKPNLGNIEKEVTWEEVLENFRGTEVYNYLSQIANRQIKVAHKIQYIDIIPRKVHGIVKELLQKADERGIWRDLVRDLGLEKILDRELSVLSGGELQKFIIAVVLSKNANAYFFDEPCSYLDVRERIRVARIIREYTGSNNFVVVVEHDIAILDYISDNVVILYGEPGVYGIVSKPYAVRAGINNFLRGFLPAENMRIRDEPITYTLTLMNEKPLSSKHYLGWSKLLVKLDGFKLLVESGEIREGEVIGIVGPNGIGKTTFIRTLAGEIKPKEGYIEKKHAKLEVSYKPQRISPEYLGEDKTVEELLATINKEVLHSGSWLHREIIVKFGILKLLDREISELSGGELQKVAIAATLSKEADIYLLDEPSAYLDVEERLIVAKTIKRLTEIRAAAAILVEHDIALLDYISDRLMVFSGNPAIQGYALKPRPLSSAMNIFLEQIGVTIRKDPETGRPRINKEDSYLDRLQKRMNKFYYIPSPSERR